MNASVATSLGALRPTRQGVAPLPPWCPQPLAGPSRQRESHQRAVCSSAEPCTGPARLQRRGGGSGAPLVRRRGLAPAAAAAGQVDVEHSEEVVLLDLHLLAAPGAVALALFGAHASSQDARSSSSSGSSSSSPTPAAPHGLLVHHMQQPLGHLNMTAEPWRPSGTGAGLRRQLRYDTPLSQRQRLLLPFGPAAVHNTEEQQLAEEDSSGGLRLISSVASEGVPFANCFTNRLEWRLLPLGSARSREAKSRGGGGSSSSSGAAQLPALTPYIASGSLDSSTRLLLIAQCVFHKRVLGPLRGQIEEQSLQGMRDAYARLAPLIQQHFNGSRGGSGLSGVTNALQCSCMSTSGSTSSSSSKRRDRADLSSASGGSDSWAAAQALVRQHITGPTAADCLRQAEALWLEWSAAGCCLSPGARPPGAQPSSAEAAAALQAVARRALPLPPAQRQQQLAKTRCVRGLVEALCLTPPRHVGPAGSTGPSGSGSSSSNTNCSSSPGLQSAGAVAASLWALAVLGGSIWWEVEAEALCALLPACRSATLREASDASWALATMRHYTPHLPVLEEAAAAALEQRLGAAAKQPNGAAGSSEQQGRAPSLSQLASLLWGLATLGHRPLCLLPLMPPALGCQPGPPSFTALCTIAWSLAVAGCLQQPAAEAVAAALCAAAGSVPPAGPKNAALLQLHQFVLALQLAAQEEEEDDSSAAAAAGQQAQHGSAAAALRRLQEHAGMQPLLAAAASAWAAEGGHRGSKQVSAVQADVAATARTLGLALHEEHAVVGFSVDIAVPARRLAVEVDGPTHFCRNVLPSEGTSSSSGTINDAQATLSSSKSAHALGATLLKRRLLQRQGWAVISVDAAQWERLRGAGQKRAFLAAAIAAAEADAGSSMLQPAVI